MIKYYKRIEVFDDDHMDEFGWSLNTTESQTRHLDDTLLESEVKKWSSEESGHYKFVHDVALDELRKRYRNLILESLSVLQARKSEESIEHALRRIKYVANCDIIWGNDTGSSNG